MPKQLPAPARFAAKSRSPTKPSTGEWTETLQQWVPLATGLGPRPDATAAEGPDPYGNPDPEWLRIDWRQHLRTINVPSTSTNSDSATGGSSEGTEVRYVEMGEASELDLVFVHGLSGSWQNWLENLPHFARSHRVIAFDLPGFGASPMPPWEISIERYGTLLHDLCKALDVRDCAVIGNSMGGFISAEAAIREPDRFEKLVLVSAAGVSHSRMRQEPAEAFARVGVATLPIALRLHGPTMRRRRLRWAAFRSLAHHPLRLRPELLHEFFANGAGAPGFARALPALVGYDILDRLEDVQVPTLIVWGRNDRIVPPADALEYGRRLRNSRTVIFDATGHVPQAERPTRFNRVLETFLAEKADASR